MNVPVGLLLSAMGLCLLGLVLRVLQWRQGSVGHVFRLSALLSIPRRYLVNVHEVVAREPAAARMHVMAAGGFISSLLLIPLVHTFPSSRALAWVLVGLLVFVALGGIAALLRRRRVRARLSNGSFKRLPFALLAFSAFYLIVTLPLLGLGAVIEWRSLPGAVLLLLGVYACLELIGGMSGAPMKHALTGALHLAFHPRPERFMRGTGATALNLLDLGKEKLGVRTIRDFTWNQLLSFDACVECGKCEAACPALAAGLPLNPKALIQDLLKAQRPAVSFRYTGNGHSATRGVREAWRDSKLIDDDAGIHQNTLWACTTCRSCVEECPMLIEHVDAVMDMRRYQTLELGAAPGKAEEALDNLRSTDSASGLSLLETSDWSSDLKLPVLAQKGSCDILLWLGAGIHEQQGQRALRALVKLLRMAGVDFAVLGEEERDTGDLARRLGEESEFQRLARANIQTLEKYRFDRILTADPHALHALRNEYPPLGGEYTVVHHSAYLLELIKSGSLRIDGRLEEALTYHDPCYLSRYNGEIGAPRELLAVLGAKLQEMQRHGRRSFCCGGGGGLPQTDIKGERRIADLRMEQAARTKASVLAVACPGCKSMLNGAGGAPLQVRDLAELTLLAAERSP